MPERHYVPVWDKASPLFDIIRKNETARNTSAFTDDPTTLDSARPKHVCRRSSRSKEHTVVEKSQAGLSYGISQVRYEGYRVCRWMGVTADVDANSKELSSTLKVHVWGGGVDRTVGLRDDIHLGSSRRDSKDYYFVQLEDDNGKPLSHAKTFQTFKDCSKNLIRITFSKIGKTSPKRT